MSLLCYQGHCAVDNVFPTLTLLLTVQPQPPYLPVSKATCPSRERAWKQVWGEWVVLCTLSVFSEAAMDCSRSSRETSRQKIDRRKRLKCTLSTSHCLHLDQKNLQRTLLLHISWQSLLCTKGFYIVEDIDIWNSWVAYVAVTQVHAGN